MFRALRHRRLLLAMCRVLIVMLLWQTGAVGAHACDKLPFAGAAGTPVAGCGHAGKAAAMDALCMQHCHPASSHDALAFDLHVPHALPVAAPTAATTPTAVGVSRAEPHSLRSSTPPLRTRYCSLLI